VKPNSTARAQRSDEHDVGHDDCGCSYHGCGAGRYSVSATPANDVAGSGDKGGMIGYITGRWIGLRLLVRYGKYVGLDEPRLKVGQYLFLQHGGKIVFFGRFVDLLRIVAAVLAGANRMNWPYFLFMNAIGGICWVLLLGGGAYFFGEQMKRVVGPVQLLLLIVAIGLAAGGIVFFHHHEKELVRRAERSIPGSLFGPVGT
jgi:hypothetical protein